MISLKIQWTFHAMKMKLQKKKMDMRLEALRVGQILKRQASRDYYNLNWMMSITRLFRLILIHILINKIMKLKPLLTNRNLH